MDKTHLSFPFAANADGSDRMELFIIGHAQKQCALIEKLGSSWVLLSQQCKSLDDEWFQKMDQEMQDANHKVLILLENTPTYVSKDVPHTYVEV